MPKYEVRVNANPRIHEGSMQYYWQIVQINEDGIFTVKHGWNKSLVRACFDAGSEASSMKFGW